MSYIAENFLKSRKYQEMTLMGEKQLEWQLNDSWNLIRNHEGQKEAAQHSLSSKSKELAT